MSRGSNARSRAFPASTNVEATLNIGGETKNSADAATIESWKSKVPQTRLIEFVDFALGGKNQRMATRGH